MTTQRPMHILVLNYEFPPLGGGAAPVSFEACRELVAQGHQVTVITMHYRGLPRDEIVEGIRVRRIPCLRLKPERSNFIEMLTFLLSFLLSLPLFNIKAFDVVHAHFIIPTGTLAYAIKKLYGKNYVISAHGSDVQGYNPDRFRLLHRLLSGACKLIMREASVILVPSERFKELILKNTGTEFHDKVWTGGNGITVRNPVRVAKQKRILYAGRLFERKGVRFLIEAMKGIDTTWELRIAGDGPLMKELKDLAKDCGIPVQFLGWLSREELEQEYQKSSIFVLPSSEESFGMVLAEAMMHGDAIITTRGTACEEVVADAGLLVSRKNVSELHSALRTLTTDSKVLEKYQHAARARVRVFDWSQVIGNHLQAYARALESHAKEKPAKPASTKRTTKTA